MILVNTDTAGLSLGDARTGRYAAQVTLTTPVGPLSFNRGWATVDGTFQGQRLRFALTHLETEEFPAVQEAQSLEFLRAVQTRGAVVAVGDFNSAADGSQTASYGNLTADYFRDAWTSVGVGPGLTCCRDGLLADPSSVLRTRIDLVLTHAVHALSATVVGAGAFESTPPLWSSDHAGVVATVRVH